jgi:hypothetical protein
LKKMQNRCVSPGGHRLIQAAYQTIRGSTLAPAVTKVAY